MTYHDRRGRVAAALLFFGFAGALAFGAAAGAFEGPLPWWAAAASGAVASFCLSWNRRARVAADGREVTVTDVVAFLVPVRVRRGGMPSALSP